MFEQSGNEVTTESVSASKDNEQASKDNKQASGDEQALDTYTGYSGFFPIAQAFSRAESKRLEGSQKLSAL